VAEVTEFGWRRVEPHPLWGEHVGAGSGARIWGMVDGRQYAAFVPVWVAEDEPAARAYLASLAEEG
jgi:hypothetical protein